jgi:Co/Zn/Cd efflux system component
MGSLALISQLLASHISNSDALLVDSFSMLVDTLSYAPLL